MAKDVIVCEREYWVYQKRECLFPWVIRMVKRYERGKRRSYFCEFDFTLHCEAIPEPSKSITYNYVHFDTADAYAEFLSDMIAYFTEVTENDREQLRDSIIDALID